MTDLRTRFEEILQPAIDTRAPYAKHMIDALIDAVIDDRLASAETSKPRNAQRPASDAPETQTES